MPIRVAGHLMPEEREAVGLLLPISIAPLGTISVQRRDENEATSHSFVSTVLKRSP